MLSDFTGAVPCLYSISALRILLTAARNSAPAVMAEGIYILNILIITPNYVVGIYGRRLVYGFNCICNTYSM